MRYIVLKRHYDSAEERQVYGVRDTKRGIWISTSYSEWQSETDAKYLNELDQPEYEKTDLVGRLLGRRN
jgi:hypothetical protein